MKGNGMDNNIFTFVQKPVVRWILFVPVTWLIGILTIEVGEFICQLFSRQLSMLQQGLIISAYFYVMWIAASNIVPKYKTKASSIFILIVSLRMVGTLANVSFILGALIAASFLILAVAVIAGKVDIRKYFLNFLLSSESKLENSGNTSGKTDKVKED